MKEHIDNNGDLCVTANTELEKQYFKFLFGKEGSTELIEIWDGQHDATGFYIRKKDIKHVTE